MGSRYRHVAHSSLRHVSTTRLSRFSLSCCSGIASPYSNFCNPNFLSIFIFLVFAVLSSLLLHQIKATVTPHYGTQYALLWCLVMVPTNVGLSVFFSIASTITASNQCRRRATLRSISSLLSWKFTTFCTWAVSPKPTIDPPVRPRPLC